MPEKNGKKIKYSVQLKFFIICFSFIALTTGLLNTYPTMSSREAVFSAKQSLMVSQSAVMASSLSVLETLNAENVGQVMELVDVNSFDRVVVADSAGRALYDTWEDGGGYLLISEISRALKGDVVFICRYDGDSFKSRAASPIVGYGGTVGAVYLYECDSAQADLIKGIQGRLRYISVIAAAVELLIIFAFTRALTGRIRELVRAMRIVREGNYEHRLTPRGSDEVTELASEFNDMTQRLQSTEELRRRFVSDASHELRTPLASIRLLTDSIVQSKNMDIDTMREFVTDIGGEAERLEHMTEKLMKLTKMDSGVGQEKKVVDIKHTAEKTLHLLAPLAQNKNVTVFSELEEGCLVRASEDDIYQIIFNLAENAVKYNNFGGNVFIKLTKSEKSVLMTVEDTGIGIPDEDMPHIFSRFYRVDKARSSEVGGSGLGLSIVHDAVLQNGGEISVQRRGTVGTCFAVSFPLAEEGEAHE